MDTNLLVNEIVNELKHVEGVSAIVLGGSRARGTYTEKSDVDLGIYYHPERPLDLTTLNRVAAQFDDEHRADILTGLGGWGPWINGGGWLKVQGVAVDFLYRDLQKVSGVIEDCHNGHVDIFYQPGHPLGFVTSMYMSEVAVCKLLWESERGELSTLKARTNPFPAALKRALIDKFAWEISFSLEIAKKGATRGDVTYAAGCCFRGAMCMLQTLYALNGQYWLNEKGAVIQAETFALRPVDFRKRIESAIDALSFNEKAIYAAVAELLELSSEVENLLKAQPA